MKRTLSFMVMAFALLLTQCRKPEVKFPLPVAPEGTTVSMTVTAGPGSKTDITTMGGITWSSGDKLYVGDGTKYVGYLTIVSGVGTPTGTFSGDVTLTGITEGAEKDFGFFYLGRDNGVAPSLNATTVDVSFATQEIYADANSKLANASKYHIGYGSAKGTVTDGVVTGINVTLVSKVALARFSFKTDAAAYTGALALSGTGICNKMTVSFASGTGFSFSGTPGNISLTGSHAERYVMLVPTNSTDKETLTFGGGMSGTTALENGIESNKFYGREVAIEVKPTPKFSVSDTTTVEFSPGNLYWDGTDSKWKFEANQWNFRTYEGKNSCINGSVEEDGTPSGHWGLFGWSTGSTTYGMSTSDFVSGYSGNFKDWGGLAIDGYDANTWRTLSRDEWNYLLSINPEEGEQQEGYGREDALKLSKWSAVTFGESGPTVSGLIIMPDGWEDTLNETTDYTTWQSLESSGAVFLPAAGDRDGTDVGSVGSLGNYWSSTPYDYGEVAAYYMYFSSGSVYKNDNFRYLGYAVRLVR